MKNHLFSRPYLYMKKINSLFLSIALIVMGVVPSFAQKTKNPMHDWTPPSKYVIDTRIDNMGYWRRIAELGLVPVAPENPFKVTTYTGNEIHSSTGMTTESTDVPTNPFGTTTQSENSIAVHPLNDELIINSNNSTGIPASNIYGANYLYSTNAGALWGGIIGGAGGSNSGDPAACIDRNGKYFIGFINSTANYGQSVAYSTNQGLNWTAVVAGVCSAQMLDKNHLWCDVSPTSPYVNNLYDAWSNLTGSGANNNQIEFVRSTDSGLHWSTPQMNISSAIAAGSHNQGVNITTGPNGEVYAFWAVYDDWPEYEATYGFAKSTNGGVSFSAATRFLTGCKGVRSLSSYPPFLLHTRTNSFPSATCDISGGTYNGNLYMVWTNQGVPGINTGSDIDIYLVKSTNQGTNWSAPIRVTNDALGSGKHAWFPWVTCDPVTGAVSVVFYDDRNCSSTQAETWVANSIDGGATWDNFKVSDVAFTPTPISGLAGGYMGDYLGITARNGKVYPCWSDNRSGAQITYVSPYTTGPPPGQPFITYNAYTLNDPLPGGNNNHQMDYNESNSLTLAVKNTGDQTSTNVNVTLSTICPFIHFTDATQAYGNINAGQIVSMTDAFAYTVDNNIPDGTLVTFAITATDNSKRTYVSNFTVEAHAPALAILNYTISDPLPGGNNNGMLDPDEVADVIFSVSNPGDYDVLNVIGTLTTTNTHVSIGTPTFNLNTLNPAQTKQATYSVVVDGSAILGSSVDLNMSVSGNSGNYTAQKTYIVKVGLTIEDWETNTFTKYPWIQDTPSTPWTITNVAPYEGIYSAKSGAHNITDGLSSISIVRNFCANDSISFYRKVGSESGWNFFNFYIDGALISHESGVINWSRLSFPVTAGNHTFKWEYDKDGSVNTEPDCAWIDYIVFPAVTDVSIKKDDVVANNVGLACYPNPVNNLATIVYSLEKQADVSIKVYNNYGKEVGSLLNNQITYPGSNQVLLNTKGMAAGMYFIVLTANGKINTTKIVIN